MKVKKYVAPSMTEAMQKVKGELGEDAVILNSKLIYTGGILGLFKKKNIEVIAAIDSNQSQPAQIVKEKPQILVEKEISRNSSAPQRNEQMEKEMVELKRMISNLSIQALPDSAQYPNQVNEVIQQLILQDIGTQTISDIGQALAEKWRNTKEDVGKQDIIRWCKAELLKKISNVHFGGISFQKKFINIVGPTGVGKTTTLAKIAAEAVINQKKKVAFITTDTYRIAAIDQLKTYASLLNVPVEVVYKLEDFKHAVDSFKDYDLIFIDTAGRNYREEKYVNELQQVIDFDAEMETFLVLSLTSRESDLENVIQQFKRVGIHRFIFTKRDETASYGMIYNLILKHRIGAAYLTIGQDVPDDIEEASSTRVVDYLLEGMGL
ncbi:flagellar biosynthesis protein FlhF [Falsibacillus albus]|uniref:Flagellar biosynthesis protein FlhF n=1 Tax=Falsibacillus albus TaxID=2478915 RepID=A0A3L7JY52_9BACI|nr:flagellar biosynthesis protein FlhF [Falsibacillus albus]RLQ95727.1 flagellar biosynthesis protein FlhF [Falsibacillus albus]